MPPCRPIPSDLLGGNPTLYRLDTALLGHPPSGTITPDGIDISILQNPDVAGCLERLLFRYPDLLRSLRLHQDLTN